MGWIQVCPTSRLITQHAEQLADNIAPPVAACLGDLVTLFLLGAASTVNIILVDTPIPLIMIILLTVSAVGWAVVTRRNKHVNHLLYEGWVPLFTAMIISCGTGIVLDLFVSRYDGFALLAAVIAGMSFVVLLHVTLISSVGLPGNVGSIFVSRLSTALHASALALTSLPNTSSDALDRPSTAPQPSPRLVMITLLCVTFPIEVAFLVTLRIIGWLHVPFIFLVFSLLFFCIAVCRAIQFNDSWSLPAHSHFRSSRRCFWRAHLPIFCGSVTSIQTCTRCRSILPSST